jgi:uncharacterized protein YjiS (DUF1127 family)
MAALRFGLALNPARKLEPEAGATPTPRSPWLPSGRFWATLGACIAEWRDRSRSRGELRACDERDLADIGQTRASAFLEARKPFWEP